MDLQLAQGVIRPFDGSSCEVRKYDRDFRVGDILILKEYNGEYTGKSVTMRICYALSDPDFVKDGYVILGIQGV